MGEVWTYGRLVLPYAAFLCVVFVFAFVAVRLLRTRLVVLLAGFSPNGTARDGLIRACVLVATTALSFPALFQLCAYVGFALGYSLNGWTVVVAELLTVILLALGARTLMPDGWRIRAILVVLVSTLALFAISASAASFFHSISWDGNWYHGPGTVALANGWNPVLDPHATQVQAGRWRPNLEKGGLWDLFSAHYPKGGWVQQAGLYLVSGRLRTAKGLSLVLLVVQFLAVFAAALKFLPGSVRRASLVALLAAVNPVTLSQLLTLKIDGRVASLITAMIALSLLSVSKAGGWPALAGVLAVVLSLATIKFTGAVYAVVFLGLLVALLVRNWRELDKRAILVCAGIGFSAIAFVAVLEYAPNVIDHGSPFYPLFGRDKVDIVSTQMPPNFAGANGFERLFMALFSRGAEPRVNQADSEPTHLKIPFVVSLNELRAYASSDTRVAGFGPLFGGALLLAFVLIVFLVARLACAREPRAVWIVIVLAAILLSALINPQSWWARWTPQIWLVPVVLVWAGLSLRSPRPIQWVTWALAVVLLVNSALVAGVNFANTAKARLEIEAALDEVSTWPQPVVLDQGAFDVTWTKFEERGIAWRLLRKDETPRTAGLTIPYLTTTVYPAQ